MNNISSLISAATSSLKMDTAIVNHEGAPAYRRSLKEQILQVLSTNTLNDTFYVKKEQLAQETIEVLIKAREKDPRYLAQAIVWARQNGLMKLVPVLALAILSGKRGLSPKLFLNTFQKTILTPDDLRTFVVCIKDGNIPGRSGLGGIVREAVRQWISGISEYHAIKYGSVRSEGVTLRDVIRMVHPKPTSDACNERFGWLVKGSLGSNAELNPSIHSFEKLKRAKTEDEQVALVRQGKLPFEVVVPSVPKMTKMLWAELLLHAPYMNLLRSLNSFQGHGVFDEETYILHAVAKLTDQTAVERSRVLPFRFFDAWKAYSSSGACTMRIADALRKALELSFLNLPEFGLDKHVTLAPDVSGSMHSQISEKGTARYIDVAGIFAGALLKRVQNGLVLPFGGNVVLSEQFSQRDDILVTAEKIANFNEGSTALGAPIQYLLNRKIKTDIFIGITDNEDWAYGRGYSVRASFLELWRDYRKEVNPDAVAFLITIDPNRCASAPQGEKGVHFIYGWSDQVLRYIDLKLSTGASQVENVEAIPL